jgi:endoglycosylceramidase
MRPKPAGNAPMAAAGSVVVPANPVMAVAAAVSSQLGSPATSPANDKPRAPADTPLAAILLAAARREFDEAANSATTAARAAIANVASNVTAVALVSPSALTGVFAQIVYSPLHSGVETWIHSGTGQEVDAIINRVAGSYVIGDGAAGTQTHPAGGAGGWLAGDGGAGWDSTQAGVAGGSGGAAGWLGNGGIGGAGGAGAAGGTGGAGGAVMGVGGNGGAGGPDTAGGDGGDGGAGGDAKGLVFGIGGRGGDGGAGTDGGRGGDGGDGAKVLGSGGDGGDAGHSGVGGGPTALAALGGTGGTAGIFGTHGAVGAHGSGGITGAATRGTLAAVSTTGTWFTNSDGQVVLMHGLNEVYKLAPNEPSATGFSADDAAFLAANGFNVVRLGVIWSAVEPEPGVYDTAYIDSIQQTVQTLADQGIYTILDFHQDEYSSVYGGEGAPAWASLGGGWPNLQQPFPLGEIVNPAETHAWDAFWANAKASNGVGLEGAYSRMLETVAGDFAGNSDVVGYELMNEPYPGTQALSTLLGSGFFDSQELHPFYDQAATAIRAVDPTTPIFYEPDILSEFGVSTKVGTVDAAHTVYAYHNYVLDSVVANEAQLYSRKIGIPSFVTELGASASSSVITPAVNASDANLSGWTDWTYSGVGDITSGGSTRSESLVYDPSQPPVGDNVNTTALALLTEPFPQTVSGTPIAFSYNSGKFEFSYSTEKADGSGRFAAGAQTAISVPAVQFANGYQATVTGGHVVSAPNAPILMVVSDDGAETVNVTVTAAPTAG